MTVVRKRKPSSSVEELIKALNQFIPLLEEQKELDAVKDLHKALGYLANTNKDSQNLKQALHIIEEAFGDEHELEAYTVPSKEGENVWTQREALYLASTCVLNLASRIKKTF